MAAVLDVDVGGILLGGGMVHSGELVERVRRSCDRVAPVSAYPGEFESEAMAAGALRVLEGEGNAGNTRVSRAAGFLKETIEMHELTVGQVKRTRTLTLALSTLTLLFLGLIYAFSMYVAPMSEAFGLEKTAIGPTFNIMMIMFCLAAVGGTQLEKLIGCKGVVLVGAALYAIGFIGTALFAQGNIVALYLLYGVCAGSGVGMAYNSLIATTNLWFPDKVGFSSGILLMGLGISSLILGTASVQLIGMFSVRTVFIGIGIVGGCVTLTAALVLRRPPAEIVQIMVPERSATDTYDPGDEDQAIKTPLLYVYWVWSVIVIGIGLATIGNCASDAQLVGWDAGFATLLVGLVSTCNGIARLVIGMIYDKTNVKVAMLLDGLVAFAATSCIAAAFALGQPLLYAIGALCCGFCYGGVPVVASAFARQRFGAKNYPLNLSLANFAIVFGSALNLVIQAAVGSSNRQTIFLVLVGFAVIAVLDVIPFSRMFDASQQMLNRRRELHEAKMSSDAQAVAR